MSSAAREFVRNPTKEVHSVIRLIDIQKSYDNGTKALKGVNLRIDDGEFVFLVGPSGSGKSTILKLITAEIAPTGGRLMVNGYNLNTITPRHVPYMRRTLGVIFQDFRLIEKKTVKENLIFAMQAVGASPREIRKRVAYVLDLVGLLDKGGSAPQSDVRRRAAACGHCPRSGEQSPDDHCRRAHR